MNKPKLPDLLERIRHEIDARDESLEIFCGRFSIFLRPKAEKDGTRAAVRWFERAEAGTAGVGSDRMAALIKTLNVSLTDFEEDFLCEPGFCKSHYGPRFLKRLNESSSSSTKSANPVSAGESRSVHSETKPEDADSPTLAKFFGPAMVNAGKYVQLVFPKRTLKGYPGKKNKKALFELEEDYKFNDKEGQKQSNVHAEGVSGYLAFEDIRAAIHIANFVTEHTGKNVWARHENLRALDESQDTCTFAFGLGFTTATRDTEERFANELFYIYCDKARNGSFWTDYFTLKFRHVGKSESAKMVPEEIPLRPKRDIALIVRAVFRSSSKKIASSQPLFICAGRTALGTSAAAHFLVTKWQRLAALYKENEKSLEHDSLAVVIEHEDAKPFDPSFHLPLRVEESADFYLCDDDKKTKCIAWA